MIVNILILLLVVVAITLLTNLIGSSNGGVQDTVKREETPDKSEIIEKNSIGTLSDRAVAAIQYQRLKNSFEENCNRDPESAKMITNKVKHNFDKMARQLATIGTNVNPEEIDITSKDGLPPGWELK